jgi:hypothetical protein
MNNKVNKQVGNLISGIRSRLSACSYNARVKSVRVDRFIDNSMIRATLVTLNLRDSIGSWFGVHIVIRNAKGHGCRSSYRVSGIWGCGLSKVRKCSSQEAVIRMLGCLFSPQF